MASTGPTLLTRRLCGRTISAGRFYSSAAARTAQDVEAVQKVPPRHTQDSLALARMPTFSLIRSLVLGTFFTSPWLFRPGFAVLQRVANSSSPILNPDRNPVLRAVIKPFVYDQFCAGRNHAEIETSISRIKQLGFSGVILCYGKELEVGQGSTNMNGASGTIDPEIDHWRKGNLETIEMTGDTDFLGMKFTGAGTAVIQALSEGREPPKQFVEAMDEIAQRTAAKGGRIWVDAEWQDLQHSIDCWTVDLMRRYNRGGQVLIYNTLQAYLKDSKDKLRDHLTLADAEGWTLAIKLVRGAYINTDVRERIHDTKSDTDDSYNGIVSDLLSGNFAPFSPERFPRMALFLAGHNSESVAKASDLVRTLADEGRLRVVPEFGQLQGMADELGCRLLQFSEDMSREGIAGPNRQVAPKVYKCLTWGSIQECMQFLVRRVVENRGAAERLKDDMSGVWTELKRRSIKGRARP